MAYDSDCECPFCAAQRAQMHINKMKSPRSVDWDKPLQIVLPKGTFKVFNLGVGFQARRYVQIADPLLPTVYSPNEDGYIVQFDTWIENVKQGLPLGFTFPLAKYDVWTECIDALREQGFKITKT